MKTLTLSAAVLALAASAYGQVRNIRGVGPNGETIGTGSRTGTRTEQRSERELMERSCERYLDKAEKHLAAKAYGPACREAVAARNLLVTQALLKRCKALYTELNKIGAEQLAQADLLYEKARYAEALKEYRRLAGVFHGLPVGAQAANSHRQCAEDPACQAALKEAKAQNLFQSVARTLELARPRSRPTTRPNQAVPRKPVAVTPKAILALDDEKLLRVADNLRQLARICSGAPTASRAANLLRAIQADPAGKQRLAALSARRKAEGALKVANAYHKAGMVAKALTLYRKVIKEHAGTPQAAQARAQIAVIKAELAHE